MTGEERASREGILTSLMLSISDVSLGDARPSTPPREEKQTQSKHDTSWITSVPSKETYIF